MKKPEPTLESNPQVWLAARLAHKDEAVRNAALETVREMGPAGIDLMLDFVREEAQKKRKSRRGARWGFGIYFGVIGVVVLVWLGHGLFTGDWDKFPTQMFNMMGSMASMGGALAVSVAQKTGTKWLSQFRDPRLIGPLLDAIETGDKELKEVAGSALVTLLPEMDAHQAELLTPRQREVLRSQLRAKDRKLVAAVLKALPVMADTSAIPAVETVIYRSQKGAQPDQELFETAYDTLKRLEAQKELAREKETLLRPAEGQSGDHLLRPALSQDHTPPEALLRPVEEASQSVGSLS